MSTSTYQQQLLLEALVNVHSFEQLAEGDYVIDLLVENLGLSFFEAEVLVEGAFNLKQVRQDRSCRLGHMSWVH